MEKSLETNYRRVERVVNLSLWGILLLVPLGVQGYEFISGTDAEFDITGVLRAWVALLPFFVLFWVHDLFLIRLLFRKGWRSIYLLLTAAVIAGTIVVIDLPHRAHRKEKEREVREVTVTDAETGEVIRQFTRRGPWGGGSGVSMFLITNVIFALFTVSTNIAVRLYFRGRNNRRRIALLEAENTSTRLQFLKYQINPHFFMNTLNNIHALIDIDAERARDVVMELSKLMRYVLYDIDRDKVTLQQEVDFLKNYIELMKIRVTDNVEIRVSMPAGVSDIKLPPLLFIPFVENIFKHGVSYREPSIIEVSIVAEDGKVTFRSVNSNHAKKVRDDRSHGIGLENLRRRLDLLYGDDYTLEIKDNGSTFVTRLTIPVDKTASHSLPQA
ncbi:MAG: histidine kinase [Barnesiella sp.]|nr:histidine kinase [Barnesiella sp.]